MAFDHLGMGATIIGGSMDENPTFEEVVRLGHSPIARALDHNLLSIMS
jgi:hypothetical protein